MLWSLSLRDKEATQLHILHSGQSPTDFEKVMWLVTNRSVIYMVNLWTEEIALKFVLYAITHS